MARRKTENRLLKAIGAIGGKRILAALIVAILGGTASFMLAVSGTARNKAPAVALVVVPGESVALAARAEQLLFANPSNPPSTVATLARAAVKQQALNARAVRLLGYAAEGQGDMQRASALIKMAAKLSRREHGAQLWLIEYNAQANDTKKTLEHYDIVLTTRPSIQALLFAQLSSAIEDESIRAALMPYVRSKKPWVSAFISHAIANDKDPSNIVALIVEAGGLPKSAAEPVQFKNLLNRLVNEARFDDARRIYRLAPGTQPARLVDPAFTAADRDGRFGAIGWTIPGDPNAGGGFVGGAAAEKPALSVFANAATTRTVASRLLYLAPGTYRFSAKGVQIEYGDTGYVQFRLQCPGSGLPGAVWTFDGGAKTIAAPLSVPANCPVQFLQIVASGGNGQLGLEARIADISISR